MQALYDVAAPAKLNLFLHITGRRADGYHFLQSAFMLIDWCDTLHFERRRDGQISREDLAGTLPQDDLIVRAARALQVASGCPLGAHVGVVKRIPEQAGMGGGSSDAATTLLALNRLWQLGLTRSELMALAAPLGADVPFFLGGTNAWQTPAIFSRLSALDYFGNATISGFAADHFGFGRNDLQSIAEVLCPEISQALLWLESLGLHGRMTGSGSAVFAALPHDVELPAPPGAWQLKVCDNLMVHPLAGWASG